MPPKGWRKNAEGSHPVHTKERDQISIEDILFPKATVTRLAKSVMSEGLISKDSVTAVQRSATAFVSYLLVSARQNAKKFDRKTINPQDIFVALKETEFGDFTEHIQSELNIFLERKEQAKLLKKQNQQEAEALAATTTNEEESVKAGSTDDMTVGEGETVQENNDTVDYIEEETQHDKVEEPQSKKAKITREDTVSDNEA